MTDFPLDRAAYIAGAYAILDRALSPGLPIESIREQVFYARTCMCGADLKTGEYGDKLPDELYESLDTLDICGEGEARERIKNVKAVLKDELDKIVKAR